MTKQRRPLQVSPEFLEKIDKIQREIRMKQGRNLGRYDILNGLIKLNTFEELEKQLINGKVELDINLRFDERRK